MKTVLTALVILTAPVAVMAYGPSAPAKTEAPASTTWKGTLTGVTTQNKALIEAAIKKIAGVEKATVTDAGAVEITGKSFTEAQVASALPTGVSIKK